MKNMLKQIPRDSKTLQKKTIGANQIHLSIREVISLAQSFLKK